MKIISPANETYLKILKSQKGNADVYRKMHFCVEQETEDGVLIYNMVSKEMILLSQEEYAKLTELEELREHCFAVPENTNEKACVKLIRMVVAANSKKREAITTYRIFTTTDCNARCFYCYELADRRINMTQETARKVADYIIAHCCGEEVEFIWYGGEPLYNHEVIDTICDSLRSAGIQFKSWAVSNGYLFDDEMVRKAVEKWNVNRAQITLDGTEAVYNKVKAYIYRGGNPYEIVLANIERLLNAGISVAIRLNLDLHNAEDLLTLVEELKQRFEGKKKPRIYAHHIMDMFGSMGDLHTDEEWRKRQDAMDRLEALIEENGFAAKQGINKGFKINSCNADSGSAVTVLPNGELGLCESYLETEFIGHIDREELDQEMIQSWKELVPEIPECDTCFYYPDCFHLKKCCNVRECYHMEREIRYKKIQFYMRNEYRSWKEKQSAAE